MLSSRRIEDETPPNEVSGFSDAVALGIVGQVPLEPPSLIPGVSAVKAFWLFIATVVVSTGLVIASAHALDGIISSEDTGLRLLIAVPGVLWFLAMLWGLRRVGYRLYTELAAGYATFRPLTAGFRVGDGRGFGLANLRGPWDFRGVWALDSTGRVVTPPDRSVLAPGFYPSPHRVRQLELWTGLVWMGEYRDYPLVPR